MSDPDYYKVLGVSKTASQDEIRKAYKKLARENHPDRNPDDKAAAERFKQVQEAYGVLSNEEKRKQYDQFGHAPFTGGGPGFQGGSWRTTSGGGPDFSDLFGDQFDLGDLFGGAFRGGRAQAEPRRPRPQKGQDIEARMEVAFQTAALGGTHEIVLQRGGATERLDVKIPPGVHDGGTIRLAGQGHPGTDGGPAGDLLVRVKIAPHPYFRREGHNLLIDVPITPSEAALGAKIDVPTLSEGNVVVTIPPGTSGGAKLRLRGKGVPDPKGGVPGDELVVIKIAVPKQLSEEAKSLYEQLAKVSPHAPRAGRWPA
jgi:DnaJ-class molecular chaperone